MKKKLQTVVLTIFVIVVIAFLAITGIKDLTNKDDLYTVRIDAGAEILAVEHSINGLIPIGTDHYYWAINEETMESYVILASKNWGNDTFDEDGYTINSKGTEITGLAKKITDHDILSEITDVLDQVDEGIELTYPAGRTSSLDLNYKKNAYMRLVSAALILILSIVGVIYRNKVDEINPKLTKIYLVVLIVAMILMIVAIR